jgi:Beta-lactamase enzyme family
VAAVGIALAAAALLGAAEAKPPRSEREKRAVAAGRTWPPEPYPSGRRVAAARRFAEAAPGAVAFAVMDGNGGVRGLDQDARFSSASVSKPLLLAAELRLLRREGEPLDEGTRSTLESMIEVSDNDAADNIYARVGDEGMEKAAERAGMRDFEPTPGFWGGAQVTAADMARFFFYLDRNLVGPHARYAKSLLANVNSVQRWGIPATVDGGWRVYFKGGWRPPASEQTSGPVTHQAALLERGSGQRVAIAILTDQSPGSTSFATLEGITGRLLADDPPSRRWPAP